MNDLKIIIGFKTYKIEDDLYTSLQKKDEFSFFLTSVIHLFVCSRWAA